MEHAEERPDTSRVKAGRVLDEYDATSLVGLKTLVHRAAIERVAEDGEVTIELPKQETLLASAAVARCLMPIKLRGHEMKAIRRIMKLTMAELADALGHKTAVETIARWESEVQPMGGYAEKVLRLLICERLTELAPGVSYKGSMISDLKVLDPWLTDKEYEVPYVVLEYMRMKDRSSGSVIEAWVKEAA